MALVVNWSDSPLSIYKVVFRRPLSHNHTYKHRSKVAQILNLFFDFVSWQHGKIIVKQVTFQLLSGRNYNNKKKRVAVPKVLYETNNFARNIIFLSLPCDRQLDQSCKKMKRLSQPLFHNFVNGKKEKNTHTQLTRAAGTLPLKSLNVLLITRRICLTVKHLAIQHVNNQCIGDLMFQFRNFV